MRAVSPTVIQKMDIRYKKSFMDHSFVVSVYMILH